MRFGRSRDLHKVKIQESRFEPRQVFHDGWFMDPSNKYHLRFLFKRFLFKNPKHSPPDLLNQIIWRWSPRNLHFYELPGNL